MLRARPGGQHGSSYFPHARSEQGSHTRTRCPSAQYTSGAPASVRALDGSRPRSIADACRREAHRHATSKQGSKQQASKHAQPPCTHIREQINKDMGERARAQARKPASQQASKPSSHHAGAAAQLDSIVVAATVGPSAEANLKAVAAASGCKQSSGSEASQQPGERALYSPVCTHKERPLAARTS